MARFNRLEIRVVNELIENRRFKQMIAHREKKGRVTFPAAVSSEMPFCFCQFGFAIGWNRMCDGKERRHRGGQFVAVRTDHGVQRRHASPVERIDRVGNQRTAGDRDERFRNRIGRAAEARAGSRHQNDRVGDAQGYNP